jgi:mRNA interferase MazF
VARGLAWGDIRLVAFGKPDKTRPALLLTRTPALGFLSTVTVAPITTTVRDVPSELRLGDAEGMKAICVAKLDSLQTIAKERLGRYVGRVDASRRRQIREALLFALELDED